MRSKKMAVRKLRVLVLYGGDAATGPRNELVSWMVEKKALNVEPVQVAWGTAHSEGSVADRVKKEIDLADKAIAIVTKDTRSPMARRMSSRRSVDGFRPRVAGRSA